MWQRLNHGPLARGGDPSFNVEPLEARRLLAASVAGELTVTGTKLSDTIVVRLSATDENVLEVVDNGVLRPFEVAAVESLRIIGLEGRDTIAIDDVNGVVDIEAFISGGHGNDTLTSGAGDSTLNGGNGDDVLNGGAGDDELEGGRDTDSLTGGPGEDVFPSSDTAAEINDNTDGDDGIRIRLVEAPQPVQDRINRVLAAEPATELEGLFREVDEGVTKFEAEFNQRRFLRSLKILTDGTLEEDETEIEISQLPPRVRRAVFAAHPSAEITEAEIRLFAQRTFYEVEVEVGDEVHELLFTERGRLVEDEIQP